MSPNHSRTGLLALVLSAGLFAAQAHAAAPSFLPLGDLPGGADFSRAAGVSADASTVVGISKSGSIPSGEAFVWTAAGMQGLGSLTHFAPYSEALAASADGRLVVGTTRSPVSAVEAFLWDRDTEQMVGLGFLPGFNFSVAHDVTTDSNGNPIVVGFSRLFFKEAFRWTESTGMVGLGYADGYNNSRALGIARQTGAVAGFLGEITEPEMEAFRWTPGSNTIAPLGFGMSGDSSDATAISDDGSVIAGTALFGSTPQAFRWTVGNPVIASIGALPGQSESEGFAVSPDGLTIVGGSGGRAFIWNRTRALEDPANAMIDVQATLEGFGIDLTGWTLVEATGVAADGITIVGNAINPEGKQEAFLATVPDDAVAVSAFAPIATGSDFSCALFGGLLECWGNTADIGADPFPGVTFTQVAAGATHVCAIGTDGVTRCAGSDPQNPAKTSPPSQRFGAISLGDEFSCGIVAGVGSIVCFGQGPAASPPAGQYTELSAGAEHACAVRADQALVCWGADSDENGKTDPPSGLGPVVKVAAGGEHTCALRDDETARCFGADDEGQASPPGGRFLSLAAGSRNTCGVRKPASGDLGAAVECFGAGDDAPDFQSTPVDGLFRAVDSGGTPVTGHACGVAVDGTARCWGQNEPFDQACPPGDSDCDGIPDDQDNCPDDFNPEQLDSEPDGVGDVCDLCLGPGPENSDPVGDPENQADEDGDGRGDLCDECPDNPSPTCEPLTLTLVETSVLNGGGGGGAGAGGGFGTANTQQADVDFSLLIDCGDQQDITKIGLGIALPDGIDAATVVFGNGCGETGCPSTAGVQDDPDDRLGDQVDPDSPDTFVFLPSDPPNPNLPTGANPDFLYFSLTAEPTSPNGLCADPFLARLTVGDLTEGFTPPFTTQGSEEAVGALAETPDQTLADTDIELESGNPNPQITIEIVPDIVDNAAGNRFAVYATSPVDLWRVHLALQGDGALTWLGCQSPPPGSGDDACTPELPRLDCKETGLIPSELLGPNVDYTSPRSFVLGPAGAGADLGDLADTDVEDNVLYVSLEARFNVAFGSLRSFNPGLGTTKLGTVQFDSGQANAAPALLFAGVQTVFQEDRQNSCAVVSPFNPFQVTDFVREENFGATEASVFQTFSFDLDPDNDNYASDYDVCPFTADDQSDWGGHESATNPNGANANGIGNACECGEVKDNDGRVRIGDTDVIQSILVDDIPANTAVDRCSGFGSPDCGPEDWAASWQAHEGITPGLDAACAPALP